MLIISSKKIQIKSLQGNNITCQGCSVNQLDKCRFMSIGHSLSMIGTLHTKMHTEGQIITCHVTSYKECASCAVCAVTLKRVSMHRNI